MFRLGKPKEKTFIQPTDQSEKELKEVEAFGKLEELTDKSDMKKIDDDDKNVQNKENEHVGQVFTSMEEESKEVEELTEKSDMRKNDDFFFIGYKDFQKEHVGQMLPSMAEDSNEESDDFDEDEFSLTDWGAVVQQKFEEQQKTKVCTDKLFQIYR